MGGEWDVDWELVYQTLASERRREIIAYVRGRAERASVDDIAAHLADGASAASGGVSNVRIDLYHVHLPKLSDANLIDWNGTDEVRPSPFLRQLPTDLVSPRVVASPGHAQSATD